MPKAVHHSDFHNKYQTDRSSTRSWNTVRQSGMLLLGYCNSIDVYWTVLFLIVQCMSLSFKHQHVVRLNDIAVHITHLRATGNGITVLPVTNTSECVLLNSTSAKKAGTWFTYPGGSWPGWLVTYRDVVLARSHPSKYLFYGAVVPSVV